MMRWVVPKFGCVLLTIGFLLPPVVVSAEPITITAGTITVRRGFVVPAQIDISGDGFSFRGGADTGLGACEPCHAGDLVRLSGFISGPNGSGSFAGEPFSISNLFDTASLALQSSSIVFPVSSDPLVTFTAPFSMSGLFVPRLAGTRHPFELTGAGLVTASYRFQSVTDSGTRLYLLDTFRYEFAATPEPSSLMLMAAGLAVAVRRIRRARP